MGKRISYRGRFNEYKKDLARIRETSGEELRKLAEKSRSAAILTYMAMPALHDDDGSLHTDRKRLPMTIMPKGKR